VGVYLRSTHITPWKAPKEVVGQADWFFLLKMPESPVDKAGQNAASRRLAHWLTDLKKAGFHPMLMSEVLSRLNRGISLPSKTVVLVYDPGYLCTYQAVAPVLAHHKTPAVWITSREALNTADRRYLSYHALRQMQKTGLWEIAQFSGDTSAHRDAHLFSWTPGQKTPWDMMDDRQALNRPSGTMHFYRLNVNPEWTGRHLVDRLLSEVPVSGPVELTVRHIKNRAWGVALPDKPPIRPTPFSLEAPPLRRGGTVEWFGTRGLRNFGIEMDAAGLTGDLHLLLRTDPEGGESLHLGFSPTVIWVDQDHNGRLTRLATFPWTTGRLNAMHVSVNLSGRRLRVFINRKPVFRLDGITLPSSDRGMIAVEVSHRLRGVAQVRALSIALTPWRTYYKEPPHGAAR
jgi:hypothetical protein